MSFRDHIVEINETVFGTIGDCIQEFMDGAEAGAEWISPFIPWFVIGGVFFAVLAICFL